MVQEGVRERKERLGRHRIMAGNTMNSEDKTFVMEIGKKPIMKGLRVIALGKPKKTESQERTRNAKKERKPTRRGLGVGRDGDENRKRAPMHGEMRGKSRERSAPREAQRTQKIPGPRELTN